MVKDEGQRPHPWYAKGAAPAEKETEWTVGGATVRKNDL
jgi:hypothetical protein